MKTLLAIVIALVVASFAFAVVDPDPDSMGIYFDENANIFCLDGVDYLDHEILYLILTNPTADFLYGWEAGVDLVGEAFFLSLNMLHPGGCFPGPPDNIIYGFGEGHPTFPSTPLAEFEILYFDPNLGPVEFYLHGTNPSSIDPAYPTLLLADGILQMTGISVADGPTAQINGGCTVVDTEDITFDGIKSLYR